MDKGELLWSLQNLILIFNHVRRSRHKFKYLGSIITKYGSGERICMAYCETKLSLDFFTVQLKTWCFMELKCDLSQNYYEI